VHLVAVGDVDLGRQRNDDRHAPCCLIIRHSNHSRYLQAPAFSPQITLHAYVNRRNACLDMGRQAT
jgi:hypothetical protein